jgi:hypothetical protein
MKARYHRPRIQELAPLHENVDLRFCKLTGFQKQQLLLNRYTDGHVFQLEDRPWVELVLDA